MSSRTTFRMEVLPDLGKEDTVQRRKERASTMRQNQVVDWDEMDVVQESIISQPIQARTSPLSLSSLLLWTEEETDVRPLSPRHGIQMVQSAGPAMGILCKSECGLSPNLKWVSVSLEVLSEVRTLASRWPFTSPSCPQRVSSGSGHRGTLLDHSRAQDSRQAQRREPRSHKAYMASLIHRQSIPFRTLGRRMDRYTRKATHTHRQGIEPLYKRRGGVGTDRESSKVTC